MQKTRGISSRGLLRRMAVRLRDKAGREVVHGDREIDQADCEDGVYSFHCEPPDCVFLYCLKSFCSFPLSGMYDGACGENISKS